MLQTFKFTNKLSTIFSTTGFTLIEILIVIGIISILISMGTVAYNSAENKARIGAAKRDLHELRVAIEQLKIDTGKWPNGCPTTGVANPEVLNLSTSVAGLLSAPPVGVVQAPCEWTSSDVSRWRGPYIDNISLDPWGRNYVFDPDYWGRTGPPGCPSLLSDGVAVASWGKDGVQYNCDDVAEYLLKIN